MKQAYDQDHTLTDLGQFIELARKKPGAIDIASAGIGSASHVVIELLEARANINLSHVPYRGSAPASLLLSRTCSNTPEQDDCASWRSRAAAVRTCCLRYRPSGSGQPRFSCILWFGLFAPKQTPTAILDSLHSAVQASLGVEDVKCKWAPQGAKVELESGAEFTDFVGREVARWTPIVKATEINME